MPSYIDTKYVNLLSSRLHLFKRKNNGLYNFRCPFCGDVVISIREELTYFFGVIIVVKVALSQTSLNNLMVKPIRNMLLKDTRMVSQEKVTIPLTQR